MISTVKKWLQWIFYAIRLRLIISEIKTLINPHQIPERIQLYQRALTLCENSPYWWSYLQIGLGQSLLELSFGDKEENINLAITALEKALFRLKLDTQLKSRAMFYLGIAYSAKMLGDRAENLELSIKYCEQVLNNKIGSRSDVWFPMMTTLTQAYEQRILGNAVDNINQAISICSRTFEILPIEGRLGQWVFSLDQIIRLKISLIKMGFTLDVSHEITTYKTVLEYIDPDQSPKYYSIILRGLADAYIYNSSNNRSESIERAIEYYERAIQVLEGNSVPGIQLLLNLGQAYEIRLIGKRIQNIDKAIFFYKKALDLQSLDVDLDNFFEINLRLGHLYFKKADWDNAYKLFTSALTTIEKIYQESASSEARLAALRRSEELPTLSAYSLAKQGLFGDALVILEQGKTRILNEIVARNDSILQNLSDTEKHTLQTIIHQIASLEAESRTISLSQSGTQKFTSNASKLRQYRNDLNNLIKQIRKNKPDFMSIGLNFHEIISVVRTLEHPLIYLMSTKNW